MATTYTSTVQIDVWKEHTCVCCGNNFRYRFRRKKVGRGGSPQVASNAVQAMVRKALVEEVDIHPCPHCGLYQPDMIGVRKTLYHGLVTLAAFVVLLVPMIVYCADGLSGINAPWLIAALCAGVVVFHWLTDFINPNSNLEANQRHAERLVDKGVLQIPVGAGPAGERDESARGGTWTGRHSLAYLLMFAGLIAFLAPELFRTTSGLKANRDWHPPFAGPGDQPYIYFPPQNRLTSIKGLWRGTPTVRVLNGADVGLPNTLSATTHTDTWGDQITVDSKSSTESTNTLWVRVQLPADPKLVGKELDLQLSMVVQFPKLAGVDKWMQATENVPPMERKLVLGPANCGSRYQSFWWGGYLGGAFLILVPSFALCMIASRLKRKALPTNILMPDEDQPQRPEPPPLPPLPDTRARDDKDKFRPADDR
jgi:hypothetical protein